MTGIQIISRNERPNNDEVCISGHSVSKQKSYSDEESKDCFSVIQIMNRNETPVFNNDVFIGSNSVFEQQLDIDEESRGCFDDPYDQFARVYQNLRMNEREIARTEQQRFEELWIKPKPKAEQEQSKNQVWNMKNSAIPFPPYRKQKKKQKINLNDL